MLSIINRRILSMFFVVTMLLGFTLIGVGADFPDRDINIIIPFGSGGGTDQISRLIAAIIEEESSVNWVCNNLVGGAGAIGLQELTTKRPNGYTILLMTSNMSILEHMGHANLTYKDFEPIIAVNYDEPALFVHVDSGWESLNDFVDAAKGKRLKLQTGAAGGLWQVGAISMSEELEIDLNIVPSATGGAPAAPALLGKQVDAICVPINEALAGFDTGEFVMLATFGQERSYLAPEVPTFKELGYEKLQILSVRSFYAPKGTPREIINILHDKVKKAIDSERYIEYVKNTGSNKIYLSTDELIDYLEWEYEAYKELIEMAGLLKG